MTKLSRLIYHPITLLSITIVSLLFFLSLLKTTQRAQGSAQNIKDQQDQVNQETAKVQALRDSLETAKKPLSQEKIFRNELLMKTPGEYVVQISDESLKQDQNLKKEAKIEQNIPWKEWQKLIF